MTDRNYVIVEEKAFLPDSIIIHQNIEHQTKHIPSAEFMEIPLYDKMERPVWQVLQLPSHDEKRTLISIPIPQHLSGQNHTAENSFLATGQLPREVFLFIDDAKEKENEETYLSIPVSIGISLAEYFFYSDKSNEKRIQKEIEQKYHHYRNYIYDDIDQTVDFNFKMHRKNFAKDMTEMVLVLLEQNMDKLKNLTDEQNKPQSKEIHTIMETHYKIIKELENVMEQFHDVLEPSIFDRLQTMFKIIMTKDRTIALSLLIKNESDYIIVKHLIHKILEQLGRNIAFVQ